MSFMTSTTPFADRITNVNVNVNVNKKKKKEDSGGGPCVSSVPGLTETIVDSVRRITNAAAGT